MGIFKIYDCDIGVTIAGVNYDMGHVDSVTIENPEKTRLIRGANAANKQGIVYKEGIKDASTITVVAIGITMELHELLTTVYNDRSRLDFYIVQRADGSSKIAKNAILSQIPQQLQIEESAESMNTALIFESYDMEEVHKS